MSCCNNYVVSIARKKSLDHSSRIFSRQLQQQYLQIRETTSHVDNNRFCLDYLSNFSYLIVVHLFVTTNNLTAGNILFVLMLINSISFYFIFYSKSCFFFSNHKQMQQNIICNNNQRIKNKVKLIKYLLIL